MLLRHPVRIGGALLIVVASYVDARVQKEKETLDAGSFAKEPCKNRALLQKSPTKIGLFCGI